MGLFDRFKRADHQPADQRLFGRWALERSEQDLDTGERVVAEFTPDGRLDYSITNDGQTGIMKMVYRVESGVLVTSAIESTGGAHEVFLRQRWFVGSRISNLVGSVRGSGGLSDETHVV
jgi:hypothetical protein